MRTTGLEQTCEWLAAFIGERAARGDVVARGFAQGLVGVTHAPPILPMVRSWLGNVAAERRLIRPDSDPAIATRILADLHAADALVPGAAERAWAALVAARRAAPS
ncbi:MAG TPA: hypothetical protein VFY23_11645 [Candidatus Limnocylindrales bacterium]|nr:hypothetical protein [Candidatus Limnocylindrales bacterium]